AQDKAGRGALVSVEVRQVDGEIDAARAVRVVDVAPGSDLAATAERGQQPELGTAAREQPVARGGAEVPGLAHDVARVTEVGDGDDVAAYRRADRRHGAADLGVPGDDVHGDLRALGVSEQDLLLVRALAHGRRELLLGVGYALALAAGVVRQRRRVDHRLLADRLRAAVDDLGRQALGGALPGSLGRGARHDEVHRGASAGGRGHGTCRRYGECGQGQARRGRRSVQGDSAARPPDLRLGGGQLRWNPPLHGNHLSTDERSALTKRLIRTIRWDPPVGQTRNRANPIPFAGEGKQSRDQRGSTAGG